MGIELLRGNETRSVYAGPRSDPVRWHLQFGRSCCCCPASAPADELRRLGIRVHGDLPGVGANLSEHLRAGLQFATREPVSFLRELRADRVAFSLMRWMVVWHRVPSPRK